jgi:hypothetical protein
MQLWEEAWWDLIDAYGSLIGCAQAEADPIDVELVGVAFRVHLDRLTAVLASDPGAGSPGRAADACAAVRATTAGWSAHPHFCAVMTDAIAMHEPSTRPVEPAATAGRDPVEFARVLITALRALGLPREPIAELSPAATST